MLPLLTLLACSQPPPAAPQPSPPVPAQVEPTAPPQPAKDDTEGGVVSIRAADLAAKLVEPAESPRVVNFWATWCLPCVEELPHLRDWARRTDKAELVLVNLDLHSLKKKKVLPFVEEHDLSGFTHFQVSDKDPAIAMTDAVDEFEQILPFTLVIPAAGGPERKAFLGLVEPADLEQALASL